MVFARSFSKIWSHVEKSWGSGKTGERTDENSEMADLLLPYTKNTGVFFCPSVSLDYVWNLWNNSPKNWMAFRENGTTYFYNWIASAGNCPKSPDLKSGQHLKIFTLTLAQVYAPSEAMLIWDMPFYQLKEVPHANGVNAVFADGHARFNRVANETWNLFYTANTCKGWLRPM
jgi:prepilin-type processing-associated H-X9-DG protein